MSDFQFISILPHLALRPYVSRIHLFESSGRLPEMERKLIVPNANLKLTLTYRNGVTAQVAGQRFVQAENQLSLTGLIDVPVIIDPTDNIQTGTIIVEFNAKGTYRFFRLAYADLHNQIVNLEDAVGKEVYDLQSRLSEAATAQDKLEILQLELIRRLQSTAPDLIYDYCIDRISATTGQVSVAQLEKKTGYSARWLHRKFSEHLGTGPKNLLEIVRFRPFYHAYSNGHDLSDLRKKLYESYHDQSHFLRSFKRFTGSTPGDLRKSINELATRHFTS